MRIAVVSGNAEGPTELNAFDNALYEAEIGDVNLIKVSSMLEADTKVERLPKLKAGSMVNCVLSSITSDKPNDELIACVAVAIGDELGCVIEKSAVNEDIEKVKEEAVKMVRYMMDRRNVEIKELIVEIVRYMMDRRNVEIKELIVEEAHHTVEEKGSAIAAVVYLKDDIISNRN